MKQRIRLSESSLHRIIKESVERVLNEIKYNPEQWANLAGQASYARTRGNDAYRQRKERQMRLFANMAQGQTWAGKGKYGGGEYYKNLTKNNLGYYPGPTDSGYDHDFYSTNFNKSANFDKGEDAFNIQRNQFTYNGAGRPTEYGQRDGQTMSPQEFRDKMYRKSDYMTSNGKTNTYKGIDAFTTAFNTDMLNNAFRGGYNAAKNKGKNAGQNRAYGVNRGTGTKNTWFQGYGQDPSI